MIPAASIDTNLTITENTESTRTFKVTSDKMQGMIDGIEALEQSIYHELSTEKYESPILSFNYGIELDSLIGKDITYVKVELKRRVQECLLKDERISGVDNFKFFINDDELLCTFDVISIYGTLTITREMNV
jgi:hypothetical protein